MGSPAELHTVKHMADSIVTSSAIMQPQHRNHHSYMIFGGYLLRETFELAYACAAKFATIIPRFVSLDSTTFRNPVPVGSILNLKAIVVYTEFINRQAGNSETPYHVTNSKPGTLVQVRVDSCVEDLSQSGRARKTPTGQFTYSYFVPAEPKSAPPGAPPRYFSVLPQTYAEMMDYLQGRRKSIEAKNFNTYVRLLPDPNEIVTE